MRSSGCCVSSSPPHGFCCTHWKRQENLTTTAEHFLRVVRNGELSQKHNRIHLNFILACFFFFTSFLLTSFTHTHTNQDSQGEGLVPAGVERRTDGSGLLFGFILWIWDEFEFDIWIWQTVWIHGNQIPGLSHWKTLMWHRENKCVCVSDLSWFLGWCHFTMNQRCTKMNQSESELTFKSLRIQLMNGWIEGCWLVDGKIGEWVDGYIDITNVFRSSYHICCKQVLPNQTHSQIYSKLTVWNNTNGKHNTGGRLEKKPRNSEE